MRLRYMFRKRHEQFRYKDSFVGAVHRRTCVASDADADGDDLAAAAAAAAAATSAAMPGVTGFKKGEDHQRVVALGTGG